jgi:YggT family protein
LRGPVFRAPFFFATTQRLSAKSWQIHQRSDGVNNTIPFWSLWYFHLPNFVLAVVMYTMLGRALLGLFLDPDSKNYIWRGFCAITDPFLKVFALVTPKATSPVVQWLFGFVWMFWLRVILLIVFFSLGILRMGGS